MDLLLQLIDFILHINVHLKDLVDSFGIWTYLILFLIIFCETGLVVTPFLPGDSLLFAVGAFAALGVFNFWLVLPILMLAAILGDTVNYWIGKWVGPKAFSGQLRFLKQAHLLKTQAFYTKHGGKTIVFARFIPIIRTFAPFVAGVGQMNYGYFLAYNVVGGIVWISVCMVAGYFFGNIPVVQNNFSVVILGIIVVSVLPIAVEYLRERRRAKLARA